MRIAVVATVWFPLSHADVIVSRWLRPFPGDDREGWAGAVSQIASVFLDQIPANDIGHAVCRDFNIPVFSSIRDALTLGTGDLAVDAVLLIGEHGEYPMNSLGQKLYPRRKFLDEIGEVFRQYRKGVPVFIDKHLSVSFAEACEMLDLARALNVPLYAGSSLPHCRLEWNGKLEREEGIVEALGLFFGHEEHYGFHCIEFLQSLVEQRRGGESGIRRVRTLIGHQVADALRWGELSPALLRKAFVRLGYPDTEGVVPFILDRAEDLLAFQFEHEDGLKVWHLRVQKWVTNWAVSLRNETGNLSACSPITGSPADFFSNFTSLNAVVERFFISGTASNSINRTHLAGGALEAVLQARIAGPQWRSTPHLLLRY